MTGFPSIDQPWLKYYPCAWKPEMVPAKSVYRNILENNRDYPKDTALIYQGFKTSYEKLFEGVDAVAKALKAAGIGVGDCVNMIISYTPEAVCLLLACSKIGALANFINPFFTADQVVARIRDTESGLLIVLDAMFPYVAESAAEIPAEKIVIVPAVNSLPFAARQIANTKRGKNAALKQFCRTDRRYVSWKDFIGDGRTYTGETEESYAKDRPMVMVYSSGTTGASKGIVLTNDGINAHYAYADFEFCRNDIFLAMIPIWFSTGNVMSLLTPLAHGLTIALEPEFKKENFAKDVLKYKPLMTVTATSLWRYLVTCPEYNGADLSFFRYPITGGEKVTEEIENEINRFLREHNCSMPLLKGYGMCELGETVRKLAE